jgi:hypothetical protein
LITLLVYICLEPIKTSSCIFIYRKSCHKCSPFMLCPTVSCFLELNICRTCSVCLTLCLCILEWWGIPVLKLSILIEYRLPLPMGLMLDMEATMLTHNCLHQFHKALLMGPILLHILHRWKAVSALMIFADYCLPDMFQLYSSFLRVLITILLCRTRESKKSKGNHVMVFVCVYSKQKECKILSNIPLFYKALAFFFSFFFFFLREHVPSVSGFSLSWVSPV